MSNVRPGREAAAVCSKHKQEMLEGKVGKPVPVSSLDLHDVLFVERFGAEEQRTGAWEVRTTDNFKKNMVNEYSSLWERIWNDSHDDLSVAVKRLQGNGPQARSVRIGKEYFISAFKTVCPSQEHEWLMWALVYDADAERWVASQLHTQPFCALGGVYAWWRCAQAIRSALVRFFSLVVFFYIDDVFMASLTETAGAAKSLFQQVVNMLDWELDASKSEGMCESITVLGYTATVVSEGTQWGLSAGKKLQWVATICDVLHEGMLSAGLAPTVAGRRIFAMSRVFGRVGRAWIRPLLCRQHGRTSACLNKRLRSALGWTLTMLCHGTVRISRRDADLTGRPDVIDHLRRRRRGRWSRRVHQMVRIKCARICRQ